MPLSPAEASAADALIDLAIAEDFGTLGDVTSDTLIPESLHGQAAFVARTAGVLAGLPVAERVIARIDSESWRAERRKPPGDVAELQFEILINDGDRLAPGDRIAMLRGPMQRILGAERIALNFLQRLSGVATLTRKYIDAVAGLPVKILDTRKTTPGWRRLEKYAVRMGGGTNHRMGLYDGLLVKDNHLAAAASELPPGANIAEMWASIATKIAGFRKKHPGISVEIEVDSLAQLDFAFGCEPDIVLLDNMKPDQLRAAVARRGELKPKVLLEASGGVNLQTVRGIAETGVDRISIGALTHSATALDIALDYTA